MIRGINKRIIEITDTGSDMFERVLFFVKPQEECSEQKLKNEADRLVKTYMSDEGSNYKSGYLRYTENKKKRKINFLIITALLLIFAGTIVISLLFFA